MNKKPARSKSVTPSAIWELTYVKALRAVEVLISIAADCLPRPTPIESFPRDRTSRPPVMAVIDVETLTWQQLQEDDL